MKVLLPLLFAMFLISCSDNSKSSSTTSTTKEEILKQVNETAKVVSKSSEEVSQQVQKSAEVVAKKVKVATQESVDEVKKSSAKAVSAVAHKTAEVAKKVEVKAKEVAKPVEEKSKAAVASTELAISGAKLFAKCAGCHGAHADRKALGKSQVIKGWNKDKIITAIHGYKDGSYGGSMKSVMKSQVSKLSDSEIEALGTYISKL